MLYLIFTTDFQCETLLDVSEIYAADSIDRLIKAFVAFMLKLNDNSYKALWIRSRHTTLSQLLKHNNLCLFLVYSFWLLLLNWWFFWFFAPIKLEFLNDETELQFSHVACKVWETISVSEIKERRKFGEEGFEGFVECKKFWNNWKIWEGMGLTWWLRW